MHPGLCCSCLLSLISPVAPALRPVHVRLSVITSPSLLCLPPHCLPTDYTPPPANRPDGIFCRTSWFSVLVYSRIHSLLSSGTANTRHPGAKVHLHLCGRPSRERVEGHDLEGAALLHEGMFSY